MGQHSQVITATHDPVLARNEAARPHGDVSQLKRLDGGLCLVAPYVDMAAVESGEDPWLCSGEMSVCLCPTFLPHRPLVLVYAVARGFRYPRLVYAYLGWVKVDALDTFAPGTGQVSAVVILGQPRIERGAWRDCTYKSCLCALRGILLAIMFTELCLKDWSEAGEIAGGQRQQSPLERPAVAVLRSPAIAPLQQCSNLGMSPRV